MSESQGAPFLAGMLNGIRESFRISDADTKLRLGAIRRVVTNFAKLGGALFSLWLAADFARRVASDAGFYEFAMSACFFALMAGLFLWMLFFRAEMFENDKSSRVRDTHFLGRVGKRIALTCAVFFVAGIVAGLALDLPNLL